ncbi:hypothetical protein [Microtetraspora sp. NBRC 16547]|uniref:hypothetical protein n=1 Tax=Microtetraspora sp. NBRC 16547 TaxID=3030993 RepID=UPI0024A1E7D4|nr:hypothetical protein [Microtetraspora sp. NBRC 16547]GLX00475.1 hypothetical protein Misp02_45610 [Microtetraspora sp. NBRC 16547]
MTTMLNLADRVLAALVPKARAAAADCDYVTCTVYATCCSGVWCWSCSRPGHQTCCYRSGTVTCTTCT